MAKKKNDDLIKVTHEPHTLPCVLTQAGKAEAANELASSIQQIESLEGQKKAADAGFNAEMKAIKSLVHTLSRKVRDNEEMRSVPCDLKLNYTKLTATLIRTDTKEVISERPMTEEEAQAELFDNEK